jgi:hypothetical protein
LPPEATQRVHKKIQDYLKNLYPLPDITNIETAKLLQLPHFKKLPQKYHPALQQVIQHLKITSQ